MSSKPLPPPNPDTAWFWEGCAAGELRVQRCTACRGRQLPPRARCLACGDTALAWQAVPPRGTVHSFTLVHRAPSTALQARAPYFVALVDLLDRARLMVNIVDCGTDELHIGTPVSIGFEHRRDGDREVAVPVARIDDTS